MERLAGIRLLGSRIVFFALILINLVPVWSFRHFPSQDGPAHVENAVVVRDYSSTAGDIYRRYYTLNHVLEPNYLSHAVLALLSTAVSPEIAHKVVVSLFVVGLPLAGWYACSAMSGGWAAILIFPFIYSLALQKGVYNFCLSLVMFLVTVGFYLRHRELTKWSFTGLALLGVLTYFTHVVSFVMAFITIATLSICAIEFGGEEKLSIRAAGKRITLPLFAFVPAMFLALLFFARHTSQQNQHLPFWVLAVQLSTLAALVSYTNVETFCAIIVAVVLAASVAMSLGRKWRKNSWDRNDGLLVAILVATAVYFVAPNTASGGTQISFRLSLFPWLLAVLWLANATGPRMRGLLIGIGAIASIAIVSANIKTYSLLNDYLNDFTSASERISKGTTLLPIFRTRFDLAPDGRSISRKVRPFVHAGGIIAIERQAIDLSNYEANTGYFPVMFRDEINPATLLDESDGDLLDYPKHTAGKGSIDYILVWDTGVGHLPTSPELEHRVSTLLPQLERGYELIYTSPKAFVHLYRHKVQK